MRNDEDRAEVVRQNIASVALPFLVERLGGEVVITYEEYDDFGSRSGGHRNIALQMGDVPGGIRLRLITAPARPPVS